MGMKVRPPLQSLADIVSIGVRNSSCELMGETRKGRP